MIERFRMLELIQQQKEIYLLFVHELSKEISIKVSIIPEANSFRVFIVGTISGTYFP